MVKKRTIGKIQLIIGIFILIIGIAGLFSLILLKNYFENKITRFGENFIENFNKETGNWSMEFKIIYANNFENEVFLMMYNYNNQKYLILSTSIVLIVLAIFFITEGLLNKKEK